MPVYCLLLRRSPGIVCSPGIPALARSKYFQFVCSGGCCRRFERKLCLADKESPLDKMLGLRNHLVICQAPEFQTSRDKDTFSSHVYIHLYSDIS